MYNPENIESIHCKLQTFYQIHCDSSLWDHGIQKWDHEANVQSDKSWRPCTPTHFIYVIFLFNTLYNIKWDDSLNEGEIITWDDFDVASNFDADCKKSTSYKKVTSETERFESMISFCFSDHNFVYLFEESFRSVALKFPNSSAVKFRRTLDVIDGIRPDALDPNLNFHMSGLKSWVVKNFKRAYKSFLYDDLNSFSVDSMKKIVFFIYKVRCNIFHGTKSLDTMLDPAYNDKLTIYSDYLIALNQMVFSFIDYLAGSSSFEGLLKDFSQKN